MDKELRHLRYSWANTILLVLLLWQMLTGFWGLINGSEGRFWVLWLHDLGGYATAIILLWKGAVILETLKRRRFTLTSWGFVVLACLLLAILGTGFLWTYSGPRYLGPFSLLTIHGGLTFLLALLLLWHVLARRFIFRIPQARNRRAFVRLAGTALAGLALWRGSAWAKTAANLPGTNRRFTGSYERGSFTGHFPSVSWLFDNPPRQDQPTWQLTIEGQVTRPLTLSYEALWQLPSQTIIATLDCTGGWYTTQHWQGINLGYLLDQVGIETQAQSIVIEAVSGYKRRFPLTEARQFLLALAVADQPLSHGHGYPLRLVAPGRRGFEWVKWVTHLRVSDRHHLYQVPVPLQ